MGRFVHRFQWFPSAAAGIAALGLVLPPAVFAADAAPAGTPTIAITQAPQVLDVCLAEGGILSGQVVDGQGLPMPGTMVGLRSAKGDVANCSTDTDGRFQVRGLGGGLYELTAAESSSTFRLWTVGASPPGAIHQVMIVAGQVTRGQYRNRGGWFGGTGSLIGGVIILGSLGGIVAGGIITGLQNPPAS